MTIAGLPEDGKDRMRAAVYYGKHDIRIEDVSVPVCHDDEVLVKVCGITALLTLPVNSELLPLNLLRLHSASFSAFGILVGKRHGPTTNLL